MMMNKVKITLSGGFHNASPMNIVLPKAVADDLKNGNISLTDPHVLSRAQRLKLDRHFCGVKNCCCGGITRTTIQY